MTRVSGKQCYSLLAVCFFAVCVSCAGKHTAESLTDATGVIHIDVTQERLVAEDYPLDRAVSELEYIPLETTKSCLIGRLQDVYVIGDRLLVDDLHNLYMYDRQGKFIRSVSRRGQGPADYEYVRTVIVDPDSRVFYLIARKKMIKYAFDGTYIETVGVSDREESHCGVMTPGRTVMFYKSNMNVFAGDISAVISLFEMDTLGRVLRTFPNPSPRYVERRRTYTMTESPLYVYNGDICFNEFGNDTLFVLSGDTMSARMIVALGDLKMDYNPDHSHLTPMEGLALVNAETKLDFSNVWEDDRYFYIQIGIGSTGVNGSHQCIYDKHANEFICLGDGFTNTLDGGIRFFPQPGKVLPDGTKIMWKEAVEFKEEMLSTDHDIQKAKYGERFEKVYQLALALEEDDNPVLILAK
ncbi:MAG: 6-bladed beta-propeller [Tannerella sp.]|jgi:hypothetical protein|nr:6-bladed beta-propeller [Tannerella sp.]